MSHILSMSLLAGAGGAKLKTHSRVHSSGHKTLALPCNPPLPPSQPLTLPHPPLRPIIRGPALQASYIRQSGYIRQGHAGFVEGLTVFDNLVFAAMLRTPGSLEDQTARVET